MTNATVIRHCHRTHAPSFIVVRRDKSEAEVIAYPEKDCLPFPEPGTRVFTFQYITSAGPQDKVYFEPYAGSLLK